MSPLYSGASGSPTKLPLWRTVVLSYAECGQDFGGVVRATALWIVLLFVLISLTDWLNWSLTVATIATLKSGTPTDSTFRIGIVVALKAVTVMSFTLALIDVAVSWHRRVILDEAPSSYGRNVMKAHYWRYSLHLTSVLLIAALPILLLLSLLAMNIDIELPVAFEVTALPAALVILTMCFAIFARFSLVLPGQATSHPRLTYRMSWSLTRGHTLRLSIGLFACAIVPALLIQTLLVMSGFVRSKLYSIEALITAGRADIFIVKAMMNWMGMVVSLVTLPIGVGFVSHCYRQLTHQR
jgi:hypothetical protein